MSKNLDPSSAKTTQHLRFWQLIENITVSDTGIVSKTFSLVLTIVRGRHGTREIFVIKPYVEFIL